MPPIRIALNIYQRRHAAWSFVIWQDDAMSLPVDLTGATVAAEIRMKPGLDPAILPACCGHAAEYDRRRARARPIARCYRSSAGGTRKSPIASGNVATFVAGAVLVTPDVPGSTAA